MALDLGTSQQTESLVPCIPRHPCPFPLLLQIA